MNQKPSLPPSEKYPPGVMLYNSFYTSLHQLDDRTLGMVLRAIMEYGLYGVIPNFPEGSPAATSWLFVKPYLDRDIARYRETVERRRANAAKRWNKEKETPSQPRKAAPTGKASDNARNGTDWMVKYMK